MRYPQIALAVATALACLATRQANAWIVAPRSVAQASPFARTTAATVVSTRPFTSPPLNESPSDESSNPFADKIPAELKEEIYKAEANTPAAQDRGKRVALYTSIAVAGLLTAFFNYFLGDLRTGGGGATDPVSLSEAGFEWVEGNFITSFFFLNKIGGFIGLFGGFGSAFLAEAEIDSRRVNAEKIYEEMVRRREKKLKGETKASRQGGKKKKKKRRSGKEVKRMVALAEVVRDDAPSTSAAATTTPASKPEPNAEPVAAETPTTEKDEEKGDGKEGVLGKIKGFYDRADSMAASQALLLNKKLEDAGVLDKITDESGLKVVGKEAAEKAQQTEKSDNDGSGKK